MIDPKKDVLNEINRMAEDYTLYLRVQEDVLDDEAKDVAIALMALYWQAGEQMEYLSEQINDKCPDGKQFCMLLGFAYSILDSLEAVIEDAHIGTKIKNGYVVESHTNFIQHKAIYGELAEKSKTDWRYLRFLRSLICAHPLETDYEGTIKGFVPNDKVFCQYVDRIDNKLICNEEDEIYDYEVSLLYNSGSRFPDSIKLVSSEIWKYVGYRFNELVMIIHDTMVQRIQEVCSRLRSEPIVELSESYDAANLDEIIKEDWRRNGHFHQDLMKIKIALQNTINFQIDSNLKRGLMDWLWGVVKQIHNRIQTLDRDDCYLADRIDEILQKIGFNRNQLSNFSRLDRYLYGVDADNFVEGGLDNYEPPDVYVDSHLDHSMLSPDERRGFYTHISEKINEEGLCEQDRIDLVSSFYRSPRNFIHGEVARFFIIVVLPNFVNQYDLFDVLVNGTDDEVYLTVLACAVNHVIKNEEGEYQ